MLRRTLQRWWQHSCQEQTTVLTTQASDKDDELFAWIAFDKTAAGSQSV
jgi:hypothetical protein